MPSLSNWAEPCAWKPKTAARGGACAPKTAAVLAQLLEHAGQLVTHDKLIQSVWGDTVVTDNSLAQCISEIRSVFGAGRDNVIETVPRRGYILHGPVVQEVSGARKPAAVKPVIAAAPAVNNRFKDTLSKRWGQAGAAAALILLGASWLVWHNASRSRPAAPLTLAVLPFETRSSDLDLAWFGDVVGEDLTFNLSRIPGARVISKPWKRPETA